MLGQILRRVGSLSIKPFVRALLLGLYHRWKRIFHKEPMSMAGYLYKTARVTGTSEYEVFCKSAESWPVTKAIIEQDFGTYLSDLSVPYYVTDFIRKNQKHIDALHIPLL